MLGKWTGESSEEEESSDELQEEDDYYYFFFLFVFLYLEGTIAIFLMDLLYMSFHHSSFQLTA